MFHLTTCQQHWVRWPKLSIQWELNGKSILLLARSRYVNKCIVNYYVHYKIYLLSSWYTYIIIFLLVATISVYLYPMKFAITYISTSKSRPIALKESSHTYCLWVSGRGWQMMPQAIVYYNVVFVMLLFLLNKGVLDVMLPMDFLANIGHLWGITIHLGLF